MMIHEITPIAGRYKARKRVGRGRSSGLGKTSGRGHKGAKSRSGYSAKAAFEGGQMPYFRRMPKRGFSNVNFRTEFLIVNLGDIASHPTFSGGGEVTLRSLEEAGLIRRSTQPLKVLAGLGGEDASLSVKLDVTANRFSGAARRLIEQAGGSVNELGVKRKGDGKPQTKRAPKKAAANA